MSKPIVLAYSGGWRSSVAIPFLADRHGVDVVAVIVDLGQSTDLAEIRDRALAAGAARAHVLDTRDEFVRDYVWPVLAADALTEGFYPMATAISRPLIAQKLVELANIEGATIVAHGSAGRDRVRLNQPLRALDRSLDVVSCADYLALPQAAEYAERLGIAVPAPLAGRVDDNVWGRTVGRPADDLAVEVPESACLITRSQLQAPASPAVVEITFERGRPTAINGLAMGPSELVESLSTIAGEHGVGRFDRVKRRGDGSSLRVLHEAPAASVLHLARRDLARLILPASVGRFAPSVAAAYAGVLDRGEWFDGLRSGLDAYVSTTQATMSGTVRVKLFKGDCRVVGRHVNP